MVMINDVKRGATLVTHDGGRAVMADSKKGIIRSIDTLVGGPFLYAEIGSTYVDAIATADGEAIEITPRQRKQLAAVHGAGF